MGRPRGSFACRSHQVLPYPPVPLIAPEQCSVTFPFVIPSPSCRHTMRNVIFQFSTVTSNKNVACAPKKKHKCLSAPFTMTSLASAVKRTVGEMALDQKQVDLQNATVDPQNDHPSAGMTTMHGMPIANTETWYCPPLPLFTPTESYIRRQVEGHAPRGRRPRSSRGPGRHGEDPPI